jgi:hypothetical protein
LAAVALASEKIAEEVAAADAAKASSQNADEVRADIVAAKARLFGAQRAYAQNYLNKLTSGERALRWPPSRGQSCSPRSY